MFWWNLYSWSLQNIFLVFRYRSGVFILYTCLGIMAWLIAMFEMLGCLVGLLKWRQLEVYFYQMILVGTGQSWCLSPRNGARDAIMSVLLAWFGLGCSWNIIIPFETVLMEFILYECYCEIMTGLVGIFMRALLINSHWIHVIPQISSHLAVVYKWDPEDGVQWVQAYTGHCQVHGMQ